MFLNGKRHTKKIEDELKKNERQPKKMEDDLKKMKKNGSEEDLIFLTLEDDLKKNAIWTNSTAQQRQPDQHN